MMDESGRDDNAHNVVGDDIDNMLKGVKPPKAMKTAVTAMKVKAVMKAMKMKDDTDGDSDQLECESPLAAKGAVKSKETAKAKAKANAKGKVCDKKAAPKAVPVEYTVRPKCGSPCPLTYSGCKVYDSPSKKCFRVYPRPGESVYDKVFNYGATTKVKAWTDAMKFCEKPFIPKSSPNYIK